MHTSKGDINRICEQIMLDLATLREGMLADRTLNEQEAEALASVETFVAIALRVFAKTNPSKLRDEMRTVEILARMGGKEVK